MTQKDNTSFNPCSHLVEGDTEIKKFLEEHKDVDTLSLILDKQLFLQKFLEERSDWSFPSFDSNIKKTCGEMLDLIQYCKTHFDREYFELEDALGGMSNGVKEASTIAKPWKSKWLEYRNKPYDELSEEDREEIEMEVIDMFHFYAMMLLVFGLDSERVKYLYSRKNLENINRQERGY